MEADRGWPDMKQFIDLRPVDHRKREERDLAVQGRRAADACGPALNPLASVSRPCPDAKAAAAVGRAFTNLR